MTSRKAVFIDIDNTIIHGTTVNILVKFSYKNGYIPITIIPKAFFWYFLYKMNYIKDFSGIVQKTSVLLEDILKNIPAKEINKIFKQCFEKEIKPMIYSESVQMLNEFNKKGFEIFFISSTFEPLATLIRDHIGFGSVIATKLEEKDGYYTGKIKGKVCYGVEKLLKIEEVTKERQLNLKDSYAFSDHISDIPMLQKVGHPVVVNPCSQLNKTAKKNKWEIRNFKFNKL
ncbi:MAG: HAD-IB family hydrolase [Candidatus Margulisbacteria bacterium]|nr:HAD-IB family hydrolase [Candidatus Margulisiibacteriota bacterium]